MGPHRTPVRSRPSLGATWHTAGWARLLLDEEVPPALLVTAAGMIGAALLAASEGTRASLEGAPPKLAVRGGAERGKVHSV